MKKLGVGQITMGGREHIVAIGPVGKGLVMEVLRYADGSARLIPTSAIFRR